MPDSDTKPASKRDLAAQRAALKAAQRTALKAAVATLKASIEWAIRVGPFAASAGLTHQTASLYYPRWTNRPRVVRIPDPCPECPAPQEWKLKDGSLWFRQNSAGPWRYLSTEEYARERNRLFNDLFDRPRETLMLTED